jgi:hypothetical protein
VVEGAPGVLRRFPGEDDSWSHLLDGELSGRGGDPVQRGRVYDRRVVVLLRRVLDSGQYSRELFQTFIRFFLEIAIIYVLSY